MRRSELASSWAGALTEIVSIPRSRRDLESELLELVDSLVGALRAEPFSPEVAIGVGRRLVDRGYFRSSCLDCTLELLRSDLPLLAEPWPPAFTDRFAAVLDAVSDGFTESTRQRGETQSDQMDQAFSRSPVPMAVSDSDGVLVRVNAALCELLGYADGELTGRRLAELLDSTDSPFALIPYQMGIPRPPANTGERRRLRCKDGDATWALVATVPLTDGDRPMRLTVATSVVDQQALEERMRHLQLHDSLTGLANRGHFVGQLEAALGGSKVGSHVMVLHLDLDGFSAVNDGFGPEVGDRLLRVAAERISDVAARHGEALVARVGADEFALLIRNATQASRRDAIELAVQVNQELAEPVYVGADGIGLSASIAVAVLPTGPLDAAELLRSTDMTLRRLRTSGRGQWAMTDPTADERDLVRFRLIASLPGAWETGKLAVEYRPLVSLVDSSVVAVQAQLRWDHPEHGTLDHGRCMEIVEQTGLNLPIGRSVLIDAARQMAEWRAELGTVPPLFVELSQQHSDDPDLVGKLREVMDGQGLPPEGLWLGMPVAALCRENTEAEGNLDVLVDLGVRIVLVGFGTSRGDLACLEDLSVTAVKLAPHAVRRANAGAEKGTLFARATAELVSMMRDAGTSVIADGITSAEQAQWWRDVGCDVGQGDHHASAGQAEAITDLLRG